MLYTLLLTFHSIFRWLVLSGLLYTLWRSFIGYRNQTDFSSHDNSLRHWTATLSHIQLMIGFSLYIQSPIVKHLLHQEKTNWLSEGFFFGVVHLLLMFSAIVFITIGSAMAKRKSSSIEKYKTLLWWFGMALVLIFIAIPWPFSPLANRPYIRPF